MKTKVLSLGLLVLSWWSILCVPAAACPPDPGDPDPPCCPDGCGACEECIDCSCQWEGPHIAPLYEGNLCVGENMTYVVYIATSGGAYCPWYPVWGGGDDPPIGFGCFYSTHWHTSGVKTVTVDTECGSDEEQVTVVEVASLLPDVGVEIDDGDGDPNTKSFVVCVVDPNYDPNVVTVTATPDPCVPEANLPACWTLTGGIGTSKLVRTVDRTTPGVTTITCTCGPSWKRTKIYVVKVDKVVKAGTDDEGPLYTVCRGESVELEAKPSPADSPFPPGEPEWTIESQPPGASALLWALYGPTTRLYNINVAGEYVVKAKCCASDTGDTIKVIYPPLDGNWEDFEWDFHCPTRLWEDHYTYMLDECGNKIELFCSTEGFCPPASSFTAYNWWYTPADSYIGTRVGLCVWVGGQNSFMYMLTVKEIYGKERILQTWHVTQNDQPGIDEDGEGCAGYWCWRVEKYDCRVGAPVSGSPWWRRDVSYAGSDEDEGEECPGTGGRHLCYPN